MSGTITESNNPNTRHIDGVSTIDLLTLMNREDALVAEAVKTQLPQIARAVDAIVANFEQGGRLFYVGAGTSGRLGILDASECPPTFHTPPDMVQAIIAGGDRAIRYAVEDAEDDEAGGAGVVEEYAMAPKDTLVGIAACGNTPFVLGAVAAAKAKGICTIGISCNSGQRLASLAHIAITPVVGPEVIQGSTRLKAGTAQKLVLNMLTTGSMIRIGKVYRNYMVDLIPTNEKLRERARKLIMEITGASYDTAAASFTESGEDLKTAVVMLKAGCKSAQAKSLLAKHRGVLGKALGEIEQRGDICEAQ